MSDNQAGKGDTPRPYSVDRNTFGSNWEKTFGANKQQGKTCMYSGLPHTENYMEEADDTASKSGARSD